MDYPPQSPPSPEVSSDLSIIDVDVPFAFMLTFSGSINAYSNLGVLKVFSRNWYEHCLLIKKRMYKLACL